MTKPDLNEFPFNEADARPIPSMDETKLKYFYSGSAGGFFIEPDRGPSIPEDAVEISQGLHESLLSEQDGLKRIIADERGYPYATKKHSPTPELIAQQKIIADNWRKHLMRQPVTLLGVTIRPESSEQDTLTSLLMGAQFTGQESFDFKFQDTWITLDKDTLQKVVTALHRYVQAMYKCLRTHSETLDTFSDLPQSKADPVVDYDYKSGWPTIDQFL